MTDEALARVAADQTMTDDEYTLPAQRLADEIDARLVAALDAARSGSCTNEQLAQAQALADKPPSPPQWAIDTANEKSHDSPGLLSPKET